MRNKIFFSTLLIFLLSCAGEKDESTTENIDRALIKGCPFVKTWVSINDPIPAKAKLLINNDSTFNYTYRAGFVNGYSKGNWIIKSNNLILNSIIPDTCLFICEFGYTCEPVQQDDNRLRKTIEGCTPYNNSIYYQFINDTFYIVNDTLYHINARNNCIENYNVFISETDSTM